MTHMRGPARIMAVHILLMHILSVVFVVMMLTLSAHMRVLMHALMIHRIILAPIVAVRMCPVDVHGLADTTTVIGVFLVNM
jgi:hypothetical protein